MINRGMFTSNSDEWETPLQLFNLFDQKYHFTLDVCATPQNAKCKKYFTKKEDGLAQDWAKEVCWMNPPYGREIGKWIKKAVDSKATVVCLLPARTDTAWFHDHLYHNDKVKIIFLQGRLKFSNAKNSAPFPSMIAIIRG